MCLWHEFNVFMEIRIVYFMESLTIPCVYGMNLKFLWKFVWYMSNSVYGMNMCVF